jgi:hypothetical protein
VNHPCVFDLSPGANSNAGYSMWWGASSQHCCDDMHTETYRVDWVFKWDASPLDKIARIGLSNTFGMASPNDRIGIKCETDTDTNWMYESCSGGSCATAVDTGVACATTSWHRVRIYRNSGDSSGTVRLCMDACGSSQQFTTNVPTTDIAPSILVGGDASSTSDQDLRADYMSIYMEGMTRW